MKNIFGIDLGTTNSCISRIFEGVPETVSIQGSPLVPSVVSFDPQETIIGTRAQNRAVLHPENTVSSVKRVMGTEQTFEIQGTQYTPAPTSTRFWWT